MLCATICHQDDIICRSTRFKSSILHFNKFDTDNNCLSTNSEYNDHSVINFPFQFAPNQVDSTTNLLDKVVLTEVVLQPTEKSRSVGPHKSILKENGNNGKSRLENKKFRSVCKPLCGITTDPNINNGLKSPRYLLYKSKHRNKYPLKNTSTLFPISWKFTKKDRASLEIYQSLIVCHIMDSVTGSNWKLTHQACQIRINNYYMVSSKDYYS